jgi:hypothetical protein
MKNAIDLFQTHYLCAMCSTCGKDLGVRAKVLLVDSH